MKSTRRSRYQLKGHKSELMTTSSICFEFTSLIAAKRSARPFRCVSAPANSTLNRPELLPAAFLRSTSGEPNGTIKHCFCAHAFGGSDSRTNLLGQTTRLASWSSCVLHESFSSESRVAPKVGSQSG